MLLVTGATGNVGAEVSRLLIELQPLPFRVAAHNPAKLRRLHGDDIPVVPFSYDDRATWDAALDGVETVFLVFPLPKPTTVNTWMKPFIDALAARRDEQAIRHLIYLDVPAAADSKVVPHYAVERHIEASGIPYTFLRASYFMQNLCRGISTHGEDIVEHGELFIPAGAGKMTFLDARDVAQVVINIAQNPDPHRNCAYLLSGPENLDMTQTAAILSEELGRLVRYTNPSIPHFWWRLLRRGVKWDVILFMTLVYTVTRRGGNDPQSADLERLLGRAPRTMRQFVQEERWRWETKTWT